MNILPIIVSAVFIISSFVGQGTAQATTEVHVLSSTALGEVLQELAPEFERASGHALAMEFDSSTGVKRKVEAGAKFDVAIVPPALITDLARQGKLTPGSGTEIARAGYGVAIRAGAPRPDISTTAAFRQTLLNAKSIIYNKEGQSGIHMAGVMERLGIAEQMRSRTILKLTAGPVADNVAKGEAELGFQSISEILSIKSAELLGPLPPELQNYTVLAAGVAASTQMGTAAQDLIRFLRTPTATQVMKKHGMEPSVR